MSFVSTSGSGGRPAGSLAAVLLLALAAPVTAAAATSPAATSPAATSPAATSPAAVESPAVTVSAWTVHEEASVGAAFTDPTATAVRYSVSDGQGMLDTYVTSLRERGAAALPVDPLRNGRTYTITAQPLADGVPTGPSGSTTVRTSPEARLLLGTARQGSGATLPFTVWLTDVSDLTLTGTVRVDWSDVSTTAPFTIAPGRISVDGAIAIPAKLFHDAARHTVQAEAVPDDATTLTGGWAWARNVVWGSDAPEPVKLSVPPVSVPEGDEPMESKPVTATLDRALPVPLPLSGTTDYAGGVSWFTFEAGQTSTEGALALPGDTVPSRSRTRVAGFSLPDSWTIPILLPSSFSVTTLDDDPDGASPRVAFGLMDGNLGTPGAARWGRIAVDNPGSRLLTDAKLTGELPSPGARLLVDAPAGPCTVTPSSSGVSFSCALGTLKATSRTSVAVQYALSREEPTPLSFTTRLSGTDEGAPLSVQDRTSVVTYQGPSCTVTGDFGRTTVAGTSGDDVLCGPWRPYGVPVRYAPGAGDDVVRGSGILDYSQAPGPLKDVRTRLGIRITGWGTDEVQWYADGTPDHHSYDSVATILGSAYADTFGPYWASVSAGAGKDVVWLDPQAWAAGKATIDGGAGVDIVKIASKKGLNGTVSLSDPRLVNVEQLVAGAGNDVLSGSAGADTIRGGGGDDVIDVNDGISGNDVVVGGAGVDTCKADYGDKVSGCEKVTWVPFR